MAIEQRLIFRPTLERLKVLTNIEVKAAGNGALNAIPESDGVYRRIPCL